MRGAFPLAPALNSFGPIESGSRRFQFQWPTQLFLVVWAVVSVVLVLTTVPAFMPKAGLLWGSDDFDVYRDGAFHLMAQRPLYTEILMHEHLYTYTPFSTITFVPFGLLPHRTDGYIWMATNVVALVVIVAVCFRMLGHRITPHLVWISALLAIAFTFLEPVRTTLFYGQINLVLMLVVLCDTAQGERSRFKGIGVGIAAGIKLTPAYFILYYLTLRQWRPAAVSVATIAATVALGWIVLPEDSRQYWTRAVFDSDRVGGDSLHPANQSLRGAIGRLIGGPPPSAVAPLPGQAPPTWLWLLIVACVVVVSMAITVLLYRGGERLLAVTVIGLTAAVVSPFSWTHHWVWFVPVIVYCVHRALTNRWWWLVAAVSFAALGAWPYRFPVDPLPRIGFYLFPDTWVPWDAIVNLYLLLYAVILIGAAVIAIRATLKRRHAAPPMVSPMATVVKTVKEPTAPPPQCRQAPVS